MALPALKSCQEAAPTRSVLMTWVAADSRRDCCAWAGARRAWLEDKEHNPKLVFVLRSWWDVDPWSAHRHAAGQFTRTPELPASFDEPPNE